MNIRQFIRAKSAANTYKSIIIGGRNTGQYRSIAYNDLSIGSGK